MFRQTATLYLTLALFSGGALAADEDSRNIVTGWKIPDEGYCDQPYVVITHDGNWLCTLTTGAGHEGQGGQHVVATISTDRGKTWSPMVDIEPADGPEASWVVPLVTPSGRVYAFYDYNGDWVDRLPGGDKKIRADTVGWYCYKYSDDHGRTWSQRRYRLPMRLTACDRANNWQGKVQIFWGIDKPKVTGGSVLFAFTKLGRYMLDNGEGWLYRSDNLLTEPDVEKLCWELLPDGEHGIRKAEFGSVQEEHNLVPIDEDRLYMVYRTTTGYPCHSYSDDRGHTWSTPEHMTYAPGGRRIKNNRACPKLWRVENGKYLFWFHNHSGRSFTDRNPVWVSGGEIREGRMHWSEPEILLYDLEPATRMSYPDLVEQDGRYWVTETQKTIARVHEIDKTLLEGLWGQGQVKTIAQDGLLAECGSGTTKLPGSIDLGRLGGLSLDLWVTLEAPATDQPLVDARDADGRGIVLLSTGQGTVRIELSDGETKAAWECDPGLLAAGKRHHIAAIVDAGPRIVTFIIDGQLCDGGDARQFGWGRYEGALGDVSGSGQVRVAAAVGKLRLYRRYLRTSEVIGNFHAGP
ncbi:MAG: exo-alpha-sialidase [Planctomycetota bacterium]